MTSHDARAAWWDDVHAERMLPIDAFPEKWLSRPVSLDFPGTVRKLAASVSGGEDYVAGIVTADEAEKLGLRVTDKEDHALVVTWDRDVPTGDKAFRQHCAERRRLWWEKEAHRPPGSVMAGLWDMSCWAEQHEDTSTMVTMSDRDAWYWGFQPDLKRPSGLEWDVEVPYLLAGQHRGRPAVRVLFTDRDIAELDTPSDRTFSVPAERICSEADVTLDQMLGRWFTVDRLNGEDTCGFRFVGG